MLTRRGRWIAVAVAALATLVLTLVLFFAGALPGAQALLGQEAADEGGDVVVQTEGSPPGTATPAAPEAGSAQLPVRAVWDGPTTHLNWAGDGYETAEASFIGARVFAPGDKVTRTLLVTNSGPEAATMSVSIAASELFAADTRNRALGENVDLSWAVGQVAGGGRFDEVIQVSAPRTEIAQLRVARGETVPITLTASMPSEVRDQRRADTTSAELSFDVQVVLRGDTAALLAITGSDPWPFALLALGLLGIGFLMVFFRRPVVCDYCDEPLAGGERRALLCHEDGSRTVQCAVCAGEFGTSGGASDGRI
ncbi:hypothetical protein [Microbacterium stercoris]|uniref:Uncharacterized protein n=1 Tax=Microbacterium stercoris TaxID=2820289 RepID=A0A939QR16_9MICO|nr:hypothetical protein [Microbacterium stercoris]MBO3663936.1 hypothetical protein [Microbacterium stercoris]